MLTAGNGPAGIRRPPSLLGAPRRMKFGEARATGGAALLDSTNGEPGWSTEAEENGRRRGAETTVGDASPVASGGNRRRTNGDALYGVPRRKRAFYIFFLSLLRLTLIRLSLLV